MRILQIGSDRSKRGILFRGTPAFKRQEAYARVFEHLDIIAFSLKSDDAQIVRAEALQVYPTNSRSRLRYLFDAVRIAKKLERPDVVSVQDPFETGIVGWLIARNFRVPLHVQVHTDFLSPAYRRLSLLNRFRVLLAGFVLRRADGVRVVSERIKTSIEKKYRLHAPVAIFPIFVDVERFAHVQPASFPFLNKNFKYKVLIVSRLSPEKNIAFGVRAFADAAPPDACLILVGEGSLDVFPDELLARLQGRWFPAEVDQDEIPQYYKAVDLVLVPSKYEGYGLVIVEALAAGKPVLSTDVGIAREAGAIVTTEKGFADALAAWFRNGPRVGHLNAYPYKNFDEYIHAYCNNIIAVKK